MNKTDQNKIKALLLDVDGVLVGGIEGKNTPYPSQTVIKKLKEIRDKNIKIIMCTGKPSFALTKKVFSKIKIHNPQVSDGGAVVFDPVDHKIIVADEIHSSDLETIVNKYLEEQIYIELYTPQNYYINKSDKSYMTDAHGKLIGHEPEYLENIQDLIGREPIVKGILMVEGEDGKKNATQIFENLQTDATLSWGTSPLTDPLWYGIITAKGISKESGARKALEYLNISFDNVLAVGDSHSDWQFIEHSKYKATLENGSDEIKKLVRQNGGFIGPHVDEHGVLKIFEEFGV